MSASGMIARQLRTKTAESSRFMYEAASPNGTKTSIILLQYLAVNLPVLMRSPSGVSVSSDVGVRKDVYGSSDVSRASL
jgi:hypothetical protein